MVNIVRRLRQELVSDSMLQQEATGQQGGGRQTQSLGDKTALGEMNVMWEDSLRRDRLDIASNKQVTTCRAVRDGGNPLDCD